jgi:glycosyltransferase involved in cell wall biosynthesis/peptidoglycan/xylan/chitin deacetylase (PgdA/CDA1 family)
MLRKTISSCIYLIKKIIPVKGIIVLMYHRINDDLEPSPMVTDTRTFRQQMEFLYKNGYKVIGIGEMIERLKDPSYKLNGKEVVITFDDGYRDNFLNAYPVLKEYAFPATIFLTTGMTGTDKKSPKYADMPSPDMLSWEEVHEMAENGIAFGAHTLNHPHLALIDINDAKIEIKESEAVLESKGVKANSFCYPYGDYDDEVKRIVREAGFDCAFTVKPGANLPGCDLFELLRVETNGVDSLFDFRKKLAGAYNVLHRLVQRKQPRSSSAHELISLRARKVRYNVLYVIWSLGLGGAERVVINLAKGLDKNKFNAAVCCLNDKGQFAYELEKEGIEVIALNKKGAFDIAVIFSLISVIKQHRIDVVHTHLWGANFWGRIAAKLARVKVIIATEHNEDVWKNGFYRFLDKKLQNSTDKIIAVSNSVKEFYVSKVGISSDKIQVIHNGIDVGEAHSSSAHELISLRAKNHTHDAIRKEFGIKDDEIILGVIGRLVPQKGHKYFLLALKELLNNHKVKGLIVGSGPMEEELKQYSKDLGFNGSVVFTGLRKDIPELLNSIDIVVMPSLREGLPIIALEAMAQGVPVVATNVGGNTEVIKQNETGILVEPENETDLVNALGRLLGDKKLLQKMGENGLLRVKELFSLENMVEQTEELYTECLAKKGMK